MHVPILRIALALKTIITMARTASDVARRFSRR